MAEEIQNHESEVQSQVVETQKVEQKAQEEEKLLKQSEVNKLVGGVKIDAYEKGKRDAVAELEKQQAQSPPVQESQTDPNKITVSKDELLKTIEDEARKREEKAKAEQTVNQFVNKMQLGMQKYDDFENVVGKLDIPNMPPQIIDWVNTLDNTADIMYEIAKNPGKYAQVLTLSLTSPRLAYDELGRLSDSLKKNADVIKQNENTKVQPPLSQNKPTRAGTDNGPLNSVSDYRKQSWLRG